MRVRNLWSPALLRGGVGATIAVVAATVFLAGSLGSAATMSPQRTAGAAASLTVADGTGQNAAASGGAGGALPVTGFSALVFLPLSHWVTDPRLTAGHDDGALYVTAPTGLSPGLTGHVTSNGSSTAGGVSPVWRSVDGGASFQGPFAPATAGSADSSMGGGHSDIVADLRGRLYVATSWAGNTAVSVSSDGGASWVGVPWSHPVAYDDHPWLGYDPHGDALYMAWHGAGGIHVSRAALRDTVGEPEDSLLFTQDVIAVPEVPAQGLGAAAQAHPPVKEGLPPSGPLAVDSVGGIWFAYPRGSQDGAGDVGIAHSSDGGLTWQTAAVPGSGFPANAPQDVDYNLQVMRPDAQGTMYVVWAQSPDTTVAPQVYYSWLAAGDSAWHRPVLVSTTRSAILPTLVSQAPGVISIAYYGEDTFSGSPANPNVFPTWGLYVAESRDALHGGGFVTTVAAPRIFSGPICVQVGCAGTSPLPAGASLPGMNASALGDAFDMAVDQRGMLVMTVIAPHQLGRTASGAPIVDLDLAMVRQIALPPLVATVVPPPPASAPVRAQPLAPWAAPFPLPSGAPAPAAVDRGATAAAAPAGHPSGAPATTTRGFIWAKAIPPNRGDDTAPGVPNGVAAVVGLGVLLLFGIGAMMVRRR